MLDNDCDNLVDCADPDCSEDPACQSCVPTEATELTCDDGVDNDCNGQTDCDDTECANAANCT